jgi:hypothetical protein
LGRWRVRKKYASFPFEIREFNMEEGTFTGYASCYGNIDCYGSVFEKGAWKKTIKENRSRIKILWQHNTEEPIGLPVTMESDGNGLLVSGRISETTRGKDSLILLRDKVISDLSVGFDTIIDTWKEGIRYIKEARLWEFSLVTWGANELANILAVRNRFALETRDFDTDFDAAQLRQTPWLLINTLNSSLDNALYGSLQPEEKYQTLHTMLSQFDERFAQWIEDAYAAMSQRAFVFERETLSLPASTEPVTATPEEQRADEVPDEMASALAEMCTTMKKILTEV